MLDDSEADGTKECNLHKRGARPSDCSVEGVESRGHDERGVTVARLVGNEVHVGQGRARDHGDGAVPREPPLRPGPLVRVPIRSHHRVPHHLPRLSAPPAKPGGGSAAPRLGPLFPKAGRARAVPPK